MLGFKDVLTIFNSDEHVDEPTETLSTIEDEDEQVTQDSNTKCSSCGTQLTISVDNRATCQACGLVETEYENDFIEISTDSKEYQRRNKQSNLLSEAYKQGIEIPEDSATFAFQYIHQIAKTHTHRGKVLKAITAQLIYHHMCKTDTAQTPSIICKWMNIPLKQFKKADDILRGYQREGIISGLEFESGTNVKGCIIQNLKLLEIDLSYTELIQSTLSAINRRHEIVNYCPTLNSTVVGCIHYIVKKVPELNKRITDEMIATKCKLSLSTFSRYSNIISANDKGVGSLRMKARFKKYLPKLKCNF